MFDFSKQSYLSIEHVLESFLPDSREIDDLDGHDGPISIINASENFAGIATAQFVVYKVGVIFNLLSELFYRLLGALSVIESHLYYINKEK